MCPITEHHRYDPRTTFPEVYKYLTPVSFTPSYPLSPFLSITYNLEHLKDPKGIQPLSKLEKLRENLLQRMKQKNLKGGIPANQNTEN